MMESFKRFSAIDTRGLEVREGSQTFRWGGKYLDNMDSRETLFTELGVLEEMPPKIPDEYRDSEFVFLANTHPAVQLEMLANFSKRRLVVADTMDFWIDSARDELTNLLKRVDGLVLNFDEAEQFTGKRNTVSAARHILELGPKFVVVKKGEHGCIFVHQDGIAALPAYPAEEVIDPTGAGDSFAGGMMGFIAAEAARGSQADPTDFTTIRRALAHGTVIASFNIESFSLDRLANLTRDEVGERYDDFAKMVRVD
jgi:sugar/nucleoside kinase (ribokinase family)